MCCECVVWSYRNKRRWSWLRAPEIGLNTAGDIESEGPRGDVGGDEQKRGEKAKQSEPTDRRVSIAWTTKERLGKAGKTKFYQISNVRSTRHRTVLIPTVEPRYSDDRGQNKSMSLKTTVVVKVNAY